MLRGGGGVLTQKIFGLNGFKSCNSRQKKENALENNKARVGKLDPFHDLDKKEWPCHNEHWIWKYEYLLYVCKILASDASKKKIDNNKINTTVRPPLLPCKPLHKSPPLTNLRGGGGGPDPRSPLWIRARLLLTVSRYTNYMRVFVNCTVLF